MIIQPLIEQLEVRTRNTHSLLCVGLDAPSLDMSAAEFRDLCFRLIDATADLALAFKPNSAFFEMHGPAGIEALKAVIAHVPAGISVILDAKRGDITTTAAAYARSAFVELGATAITLNPYMGFNAVEAFLQYTERGKGAFVLCKTSNPTSDEIQRLSVDGKPLYQAVARRILSWHHSASLGLVVGATDVQALAEIRAIARHEWFLLPGIGAQGGDLEAAIRAGRRDEGGGLLVTVSRAIAQAADPRAEALRLRDAINAAMAAAPAPVPISRSATWQRLEKVAAALSEAGCVRFGQFTLKSGGVSPIYIDLRRLVSYPHALKAIGEALNELLAGLEFNHIAAIPYAALPIGTAAALLGGHKLIYPRREAKEYGTKASIEGVYQAGDQVVLVDDLATTGGTKFETIERLQAEGLKVKDVVVVIDRQQGAAETLKQAGYGFHAVAGLGDLLAIWQSQEIITAEQRQAVLAYLADSAAS